MKMKILIAICTHNRSELLARTLYELAKLEIPSNVELTGLVVANACTDNSEEVVRRWAGHFPLVLAIETNAGISHARNLALRHVRSAEADWVIWCDDDVLVSSSFLQAYADAFRRENCANVVGGRLIPHFIAPSPDWLADCLASLGVRPFSCLDLGTEPKLVERGSGLPFGANLAMRVSAIGDRQFDPRWGVTPTRKLGFEESALLLSMLDGEPWLYLPSALALHMMPARRQSMSAISQFYRADGQVRGLLATPHEQSAAKLLSMPRWAIREFLCARADMHWARFVLRDRRQFFRRLAESEHLRGYIEVLGKSSAPNTRSLVR